MRPKRTAFDHTRLRIMQSAHDYLAVRGKDGLYQNNLRRAFHGLRRKPTKINLRILNVHLLRMLLGDRMMNAVLSDRAIVITGVYGGGGDGEGLYHIAPADCVERILSSGLQPKDRFVYLTDAPEYYARAFLPWKIRQIGKKAEFKVLYVDVQRLSKHQRVFCTDREHEFITGKIDARYITLAPE